MSKSGTPVSGFCVVIAQRPTSPRRPHDASPMRRWRLTQRSSSCALQPSSSNSIRKRRPSTGPSCPPCRPSSSSEATETSETCPRLRSTAAPARRLHEPQRSSGPARKRHGPGAFDDVALDRPVVEVGGDRRTECDLAGSGRAVGELQRQALAVVLLPDLHELPVAQLVVAASVGVDDVEAAVLANTGLLQRAPASGWTSASPLTGEIEIRDTVGTRPRLRMHLGVHTACPATLGARHRSERDTKAQRNAPAGCESSPSGRSSEHEPRAA